MFSKKTKINSLYLIGFFLNLHVAIPTYINSTFLGNFVREDLVGIIYTVGAALSILAFIILPRLLQKYGNYHVGVAALFVEFLAILGLATTRNPLFIIMSFVVSLALIRVVSFNADIFLENLSTDSKTGGIRGFFLSASNLAWVISPVIAGYVLGSDNFGRLYLVAALVSLPVLFILITKFKNFKDPSYDRVPFWGTLKKMLKRHNLRRILMANIMLRFFYAWMIIYTPIYLREVVGFEWSEIGLIFTIMLVPFVILEAPLGKIADKFLGEKELLSLGILIIAISTVSLSFITSSALLTWAALLFITRVGASMSEIMSETYFFKKIDSSDSNLIGFFRMTGPIAYVVSPVIATIILSFIGIQYIFVVLGIIMLWGLRYSLTLKDTR